MTTKNLHQRLHEAMGKVDYIQKEKKAGMRYSIVSHDAVTAKVRPALRDAGVAYYPVGLQHSQNGNRTECSMMMRFVNVDDPKDFIDVPTFGYGIDDQDKGPGKAMSYAVKYALLKTLGLETGDDPDEDQASEFRDPIVETLRAAFTVATTLDDLAQARTDNQAHLQALDRINPAMSLSLKTLYAKRKKELETA